MMITLSKMSLMRLKSVHNDLQKVITTAASLSTLDFMITEGLRTLARQQELVKIGASKTMRSRHLTGHAVDLAPIVDGKVRWDWPLFYTLADVVKKAAAQCAVPIEWGGDWRTFKDGPHFQLPWKDYP